MRSIAACVTVSRWISDRAPRQGLAQGRAIVFRACFLMSNLSVHLLAIRGTAYRRGRSLYPREVKPLFPPAQPRSSLLMVLESYARAADLAHRGRRLDLDVPEIHRFLAGDETVRHEKG